MKKFIKVTLIMAMIFCLSAIGCFIAGGILIGNPLTALWDLLNNTVAMTEEYDAYYDKNYDKDYDMESFELAGEYNADEIKNLNVNIEAGVVVVKTVSADACRVWVDANESVGDEKITVIQESKTLKIEDDYNSLSIFDIRDIVSMIGNNTPVVKIIVEVPENSIDTLEADMDIGAMKLYDLSVDRLLVDLELGALYGEGVTKSNRTELSVGLGDAEFEHLKGSYVTVNVEMGETRIRHIETNELNANVEMGNIEFFDVLAENTIANCEMGNIDIEFKGNSEDYDISYDVEMGDVEIKDYNKNNSNPLYCVELNCEMGDINVTFQ